MNDGSFDARDDDDPVRVTQYLVILDDVVAIGRRYETDAKVAALGRVAISAQPVRTEPVMGCPPGQSYAAAG